VRRYHSELAEALSLRLDIEPPSTKDEACLLSADGRGAVCVTVARTRAHIYIYIYIYIYIHGINDAGWHKIETIVSKNELLLIAMMSLAVTNFSVVKNRHGWSNKQETKQNWCVSSFLSFDFF
jgi:hypothetical protein